MRPSLSTSPKVNGIARLLETRADTARVLAPGFHGVMADIVSRNVMRNVTVSALLTVWGAANDHTSDGVFLNADLSDIDDIAGIPGFGEAMQAVGWADYNEEQCSVTLRNFSEYNTCGRDRAAEKSAERQRRYREKKKAESNGKSNVTGDVTRYDREEKRREEDPSREIYTTPNTVQSAQPCAGGAVPTTAGLMSKALRERGITVTPSNPEMLSWIAEGASIQLVLDAVTEARVSKPAPEKIPAAYLAAIVRRMLAGPRPRASPGRHGKFVELDYGKGIEDDGRF